MQEQETKLQDEILQDARQKAAGILDRARAEAAKLTAAVEAQAADEREKALAEAAREAETRAHSILAGVRHEVQKSWLQRREQVMDSVFADALAQANGAAGTERQASLLALLDEAVRAIGPEAGMAIAVPAGDVPTFTAEALRDTARRAGAAAEMADSWNVRGDPAGVGLVVASADGRRRVDQTPAARLARLKSGLRGAVAATLGADRLDLDALLKEGTADV